MNRTRGLMLLAAAAALLFAASRSDAAFTVDCPFLGGGDDIDRGFYVTNYPGTTIDQVAIGHNATASGERTIALTARLNTFDGTFLGVAQVTRTIGTTMSLSVFDFGNMPVTAGSTITFTQTLISGSGVVRFDVGVGPCTNVTETNFTTPPLDTVRHNAVGLVISGDPQSIASAMNVDCPYSTTEPNGDFITRGFYVDNYRGTTIDLVKVRHSASVAGFRSISIAARLNTFDGPLLGTASVTRNITTVNTETIYDFGDVPVPAGSRIVFAETLTSGAAPVFHDTGFEDCANVVETLDQTPPLSAHDRDRVGLKIVGRVASALQKWAVEYFNTAIGHYFMTAQDDEIFGLDHGAYGGVFVRTGKQFLVRDGPAPGTQDVCRFFTVAYAPLGSHFYTADPAECAFVKTNPNWQYEKVAFYIRVPAGGSCGLNLPVLRAFNNGMTGAPNHRFFTDQALYDDFTMNQGWAPEGIRFCATYPF